MVEFKSNHIQQKIAEKRAELNHLTELKKYTAVLNTQLETILSKIGDMAGGTEAVALVLSNWQNVVNSVSLASLGLLKYAEKDYENSMPLPEYLVRIRVDKDEAPQFQASDEEEEAEEEQEIHSEGDVSE